MKGRYSAADLHIGGGGGDLPFEYFEFFLPIYHTKLLVHMTRCYLYIKFKDKCLKRNKDGFVVKY